jgi:hypothetical protein
VELVWQFLFVILYLTFFFAFNCQAWR